MKSLEQRYKSYKDGGEIPRVVADVEIKSVGDKIKIVMSKEIRDRDGEIIDIAGMDIENYKRNPVLIDAHQMHDSVVDRVLGSLEDIQKKRGNDGIMELLGSPRFASTPRAQIARTLVEEGHVKTVSIGFGVKEYDPEEKRITKSELYETSLVSVPANIGAIISKDLKDDKATKEFTKIIKNYKDIHPKIKEYRRLFMSDELSKRLGYEKTGDELVDMANIHELLCKQVETPQSTEPKQETPKRFKVNKQTLQNAIEEAIQNANL